jgi:hypothetical protein
VRSVARELNRLELVLEQSAVLELQSVQLLLRVLVHAERRPCCLPQVLFPGVVGLLKTRLDGSGDPAWF